MNAEDMKFLQESMYHNLNLPPNKTYTIAEVAERYRNQSSNWRSSRINLFTKKRQLSPIEDKRLEILSRRLSKTFRSQMIEKAVFPDKQEIERKEVMRIISALATQVCDDPDVKTAERIPEELIASAARPDMINSPIFGLSPALRETLYREVEKQTGKTVARGTLGDFERIAQQMKEEAMFSPSYFTSLAGSVSGHASIGAMSFACDLMELLEGADSPAVAKMKVAIDELKDRNGIHHEIHQASAKLYTDALKEGLDALTDSEKRFEKLHDFSEKYVSQLKRACEDSKNAQRLLAEDKILSGIHAAAEVTQLMQENKVFPRLAYASQSALYKLAGFVNGDYDDKVDAVFAVARRAGVHLRDTVLHAAKAGLGNVVNVGAALAQENFPGVWKKATDAYYSVMPHSEDFKSSLDGFETVLKNWDFASQFVRPIEYPEGDIDYACTPPPGKGDQGSGRIAYEFCIPLDQLPDAIRKETVGDALHIPITEEMREDMDVNLTDLKIEAFRNIPSRKEHLESFDVEYIEAESGRRRSISLPEYLKKQAKGEKLTPYGISTNYIGGEKNLPPANIMMQNPFLLYAAHSIFGDDINMYPSINGNVRAVPKPKTKKEEKSR